MDYMTHHMLKLHYGWLEFFGVLTYTNKFILQKSFNNSLIKLIRQRRKEKKKFNFGLFDNMSFNSLRFRF